MERALIYGLATGVCPTLFTVMSGAGAFGFDGYVTSAKSLEDQPERTDIPGSKIQPTGCPYRSHPMTDPRHAILEAGDKLVAIMLVEDMKCEADDVGQVLAGIRSDMQTELDNVRSAA